MVLSAAQITFFSGRESPTHPETTARGHNQPAAGPALPAALAATLCHDRGGGLVTIQPGHARCGGNTTARQLVAFPVACSVLQPLPRGGGSGVVTLDGMGSQECVSVCVNMHMCVCFHMHKYIHAHVHTQIYAHTYLKSQNELSRKG